ncbi:MAG TPA: M12 family metallo-peptidase [Bacteroidota bacterium]|nr:M12 family metallo-peptidase [Bacteroidota bacterium]
MVFETRMQRVWQCATVASLALMLLLAHSPMSTAQAPRSIESTMLFTAPTQQSFAKLPAIESPSVLTVALLPQACATLRNAGSFTLRAFPMPDGQAADLVLSEFTIFSPETQVYSRTTAGDVRRPVPAMSFYRGRVLGDDASFVYLAVADGDISGNITRNGTEYAFTTMHTAQRNDAERLMSVYQSTEAMKHFECGVDDDLFIDDYLRDMATINVKALGPGMDTLLTKLAVEADFEAFQHFGSVQATETYISTLMGGVTAIYERDLAITYVVSYLRVWESDDPYSDASDDAALNTFTDYWRDNMGHVDRTLAALISRKRISGDGVSQGLAWVNQLCSKTHGYSFTKLSKNNSWLDGHVGVLAHEIGHNFGSPHTHSCVWNPPVDSCYTAEPARGQAPCFTDRDIHLIQGGGELMSYCHMRFGGAGKHSIFRDRVGGLVRGRAEAALCMNVTSTIRSLALTGPDGGGQYCAGSEITVTWDAQGNNDFSILLSRNNGVSYDTVLVNDIPRNQRSWIWKIPNNFPVGNGYRLRIVDNKLAELDDAMESSFEVLLGTFITDQVTWRNVCVGEGAWFYVRATGSGTLRYQWKKNGQDIPNENRDELQLQNMQVSDNLSTFTCVVTGDCGSVESEPALLKVFTGAVITKDLVNDTTCIGSAGQFEIEAEGSNLTYKWFYRSLSGENKTFEVNAPVFTIQNVQSSDFGSYWCEVTSSCGKSTSKTRFLIVPNKAITVLDPGTWGMTIATGSQYRIGWTHFCVNSVKIEYSINNGSSWLPITGSFDANAGEYVWNVPEVEAEECFLRLTDADNAAVSGQSKLFKIRNLPLIAFGSPNVGFGWVGVGESSTKPLVIRNTGRAALQVSGTTLNGSSEVVVKNGGSFSVAAGGSYDLNLEYTPAAPTPMNATLRIDHDAAGSPTTVDVMGEGYIATSTVTPQRNAALAIVGQYPQPLLSGTPMTVLFDLPASEEVTVTAWSLLGQGMRTLYSGRRDAGRHQLTVGMHDLPAGTYILRVATPRASSARLMHIVR